MGTIERAYSIAGSCASLDDIRRQLKREGFERVDEHFGTKSLQADLRKRLRGS
ncbi:MAG: hypothetical protein ABIN83_01995 [Sphingomicrobium sp.]